MCKSSVYTIHIRNDNLFSNRLKVTSIQHLQFFCIPGHVSVETIGVTHENRKMKVVKICKGKAGCGKKPGMWIDGGMHAREWISPSVTTYLLRKLLDDRKNKFSNRHLIDKLDWYILPLANPDGYEWSRSKDRLWRKNRFCQWHNDFLSINNILRS